MGAQQRDPVQNRAVATKNKILKAGEYLFSRKGYFQTNSRDIAKRAGVAIGSFYVYFKDKKEVLLETLERHNTEILRRLREYLKENSPNLADGKVHVMKLIEAVIDAHQLLPDYHEEIVFLMHTDSHIRAMMKRYTDESIEITYQLLVKLKDMLNVRDLYTAAEIVTVFIEEIVHRIVFDGKTEDRSRIVGEAAAMISRYLLKRPL
jgi:AcrR family transcriptional regulator